MREVLLYRIRMPFAAAGGEPKTCAQCSFICGAMSIFDCCAMHNENMFLTREQSLGKLTFVYQNSHE